jgi:hypothetical protein
MNPFFQLTPNTYFSFFFGVRKTVLHLDLVVNVCNIFNLSQKFVDEHLCRRIFCHLLLQVYILGIAISVGCIFTYIFKYIFCTLLA